MQEKAAEAKEVIPTWDLVIKDMQDRHALGIRNYGRPLYPYNGRNSLQDAYEEVLDLAVYLKNCILEAEGAERNH